MLNIKILYGSQTGYACDLSLRLYNSLYRHGFNIIFIGFMDSYPIEDILEDEMILFVCSTTGEGEEPDNMKQFWKFLLRRNLPVDFLDHLNFGVFGLGDSSYEKFNFTSKKLFKRLKMLGGESILDRGDGDDRHYLGVDGAYIPWEKELIKNLLDMENRSFEKIEEYLLPPASFQLKLIEKEINQTDYEEEEALEENWIKFNVIKNERVTSKDHFQDSRHLIFESIEEVELDYNMGDVALVKPENIDSEVDEFINLLNINELKENYYLIENVNNVRQLPTSLNNKPIKLRDLIKKYVDIHSIPKRTFFEYLLHFSNDSLEMEKIQEFLKDSEELLDYAQKPRRTIVECLNDFQSYKININYLLDMFPLIQTRSFSISSYNKKRVELLVGIVEYKSQMKKLRTGLMGMFIKKELKENNSIAIKLKKGSMKFPADLTIPVIMIGPGLGVAPFRSVIEYRIENQYYNNYLLFGCRYFNKDNYFYEEFQRYEKENKLWFKTAYSRDTDQKVYVQDLIIKYKEILIDLIFNQNAYVFTCGSSKNMPKGVERAFKEILGEVVDNSEEYLIEMKKKWRYQVECWD
ncbi:riboflavin synthase domain-like protein [Neoconidiobolus thromboides FSU 785]|nr:riboflavin synthase domain-like protein [Neoconidiobolus thromboides FSU 785]